LVEAIEQVVGTPDSAELWGRELTSESSRESTGREYNSEARETALFVNARAKPDRELRDLVSRPSAFAALTGGQLLVARLPGREIEPGVISRAAIRGISKKVERLEAPERSMFAGYWDLVESNGLAVAEQAGHFDDRLPMPEGVSANGPPSNLRVEGTAEVEGHVVFDVRPGPVVVDRGVTIESFSRITGPSYIGPNARVHSALIGGGTSVFDGCAIGGQVESSVILSHTNKAHEGYVGHSYVGEWVNLGAGSDFSNLKNTYGNVRVDSANGRRDSGMLKLGPALGDMCKVSIGGLIYAGKTMGTGSQISGLASRSIPSFTYFDGFSDTMVELRLDSVLETQRRMMERRGRTPTRVQEELIRRVFAATSRERRRAKVRKGSLR
jgi:UDP-N-acetylglucosamine diphosphorylase/glucosamine-1-phosphate N-acetyltransferase